MLPQHRPLLAKIAVAEEDPLARRDLLGMLVRACRRDGQPIPGLEQALADQWYAKVTEKSWPAQWLNYDPHNPRHRARLMLALVPGSGGKTRTRLLADLLTLRSHLPGGEEMATRLTRELGQVAPDHPAAKDYRERCAKEDPGALLIALQKAADDAQDPSARARLLEEAAEVAMGPMENPGRAADLLGEAVRLKPTSHALEVRYQAALRRSGDLPELVRRLQLSLARTLERSKRLPILMELDELLSGPMGSPERGAAHVESALQLSPDDHELMDRLAKRYLELGRWEQLGRLLRRHAESPGIQLEKRHDILIRLASLLCDHLDDKEQALTLAQQVLEEAPTHLEASRMVETLYDGLGRWDERMGLLCNRLEHEADPSELGRLHLALGRIHLERREEPEEAGRHFGEALRHGIDRGETLAAVRRIYGNLDRWDLLEQLLVQLSERHDISTAGRAEAMCEVASIHEENLDDPEGAEEAYRSALDQDSGSLTAISALRIAATSKERWPDVIQLAGQELALQNEASSRLPLLLQVGQIQHLFLGHPDAAQSALDEALELEPDNLAATQMLAELHFQQGHWQEAANHTSQLLSRTPEPQNVHELYYRLAFAREQLGRTTEVFDNYVKSFKCAPAYLPTLERLVDLCYEKRQWENTRRIAKTMLNQHSAHRSPREQAVLWLQVSLCELHQAQRDIAAHRLREMVLRKGQTPAASAEAWYEVADLWAAREMDPRLVPSLSTGSRERVEAAARRCLELWPGHPDAHQILAAMAVAVKEWPAALEEMEKAANSPDLPTWQRAQIWNFAGEVAMRQKLAPLLARSCFNKSLKLAPDQADIKRKVEILSRSTVEDASLGLPPQWERAGVTSRLDWVTEPPEQEKDFDDRMTVPYDPEEKESG